MYRGIIIIAERKYLDSGKMKGLHLAIVFGLSCIWSNTNGMHVNVSVDINQSDEPALLAGVDGGNHQLVQEWLRIVGGEEVEPHSIPWQVYFEPVDTEGKHLCGGAIICPKFIMTAAHCMAGKFDEVYVGLHNREDDLTDDRMHEVKKIHVHPKYDYPNMMNEYVPNYDYAILELTNKIRVRLEAKAIFLPNGKEKYTSESLFLTSGWGYTTDGGFPSNILQSVTVPWIPHVVCKDAYQKLKKKITPQMMCAGDIENGKIDACQGDSGGPLAWLDPKTDQVKLSGVVSWGEGCALSHQPGVYADVANQLEWIKEVTNNCNEKFCETEEARKRKHCTMKQDLVPSIIKRFQTITPHRFEK